MNPAGNRSIPPVTVVGTREHAAEATKGRHPGVQDALQWLTFSHLPPALQAYSRPFYRAALTLIEEIRTDSPELTTALNRLIESKDSAVRAGIKHDTGRAGSVPRPATVVQPPHLAGPVDNRIGPTFGQAKVPARPDQALPMRPIQDRPQA